MVRPGSECEAAERLRRALSGARLSDDMVEIYRSWTPARRLRASDEMMLFTRSLLGGVLREDHPDWTEEEIRREIARRILGSPLPDDPPAPAGGRTPGAACGA